MISLIIVHSKKPCFNPCQTTSWSLPNARSTCRSRSGGCRSFPRPSRASRLLILATAFPRHPHGLGKFANEFKAQQTTKVNVIFDDRVAFVNPHFGSGLNPRFGK